MALSSDPAPTSTGSRGFDLVLWAVGAFVVIFLAVVVALPMALSATIWGGAGMAFIVLGFLPAGLSAGLAALTWRTRPLAYGAILGGALTYLVYLGLGLWVIASGGIRVY